MSKSDQITTLRRHVIVDVVLSESTTQQLREWRDRFSVAQATLAQRMGVCSSVISDYERGRRTNPGVTFVREYVTNLLHVAAEESRCRVWQEYSRLE